MFFYNLEFSISSFDWLFSFSSMYWDMRIWFNFLIWRWNGDESREDFLWILSFFSEREREREIKFTLFGWSDLIVAYKLVEGRSQAMSKIYKNKNLKTMLVAFSFRHGGINLLLIQQVAGIVYSIEFGPNKLERIRHRHHHLWSYLLRRTIIHMRQTEYIARLFHG